MPEEKNKKEIVDIPGNSAQKNKIKYQYLLNEVIDRGDSGSALKLVEMILRGELKVTVRQEDKLLFILHSKYEGKCIRCQETYSYGAPIFVANKRAWHLKCRIVDEEKQSYFQTCLKKGLIEL